MAPPPLVVFGSQTPLPSPEQLSHIRSSLLKDSFLESFTASIIDLEATWSEILHRDSSLQSVPGFRLLSELCHWITHGTLELSLEDQFSNLLLTPLTVIIHVVEYFDYLQKLSFSHSDVVQCASHSGGFQGFCTGLLAAKALSVSKKENVAIRACATALRLAVVIGAYVDLDGPFASPPNQAVCLTIRWKQASEKVAVHSVLETFPKVPSQSQITP